jgi:hypothetical protein
MEEYEKHDIVLMLKCRWPIIWGNSFSFATPIPLFDGAILFMYQVSTNVVI